MTDDGHGEETLDFKTRRIAAAIHKGDRETVAAIAGESEAANIDWMVMTADAVGKLARSLQNQRVRAQLDEAWSRPAAIMRPPEENATTARTLIDTIADFIMSGQLDRIRKLAVHVARTPSLDRRAREVLACRIERVHALALAHRLYKECRPAQPIVKLRALTASELAESDEAPAQMNRPKCGPTKEAVKAAIDVMALARDEIAEHGRDYRVSVVEETPFGFVVAAEGFGARRVIARMGGDEDQRAREAIVRGMDIGLCALYEGARLRPVETRPVAAIPLEDATRVTKKTVAVALTNRLLQSFVEHTAPAAECTRADIVAIATEWGLQQLATRERQRAAETADEARAAEQS